MSCQGFKHGMSGSDSIPLFLKSKKIYWHSFKGKEIWSKKILIPRNTRSKVLWVKCQYEFHEKLLVLTVSIEREGEEEGMSQPSGHMMIPWIPFTDYIHEKRKGTLFLFLSFFVSLYTSSSTRDSRFFYSLSLQLDKKENSWPQFPSSISSLRTWTCVPTAHMLVIHMQRSNCWSEKREKFCSKKNFLLRTARFSSRVSSRVSLLLSSCPPSFWPSDTHAIPSPFYWKTESPSCCFFFDTERDREGEREEKEREKKRKRP